MSITDAHMTFTPALHPKYHRLCKHLQKNNQTRKSCYNHICIRMKTKMAKNNLKEFFSLNNLVYLLAVALAFVIVWQTAIVILDNYALQQEVDDLKEEVSLLKLENQRLSFNIEYYKTDAYLDLAARKNFNLKSPGERVVYVPRSETNKQEEPAEATTEQSNIDSASNFDQWLYFLFGREPS